MIGLSLLSGDFFKNLHYFYDFKFLVKIKTAIFSNQAEF